MKRKGPWIKPTATYYVALLLSGLLVLLSVLIGAAEAQTRTAVSGRKAKVFAVFSLNPDCTVLEIPEVYVQVAPKLGEVTMEIGEDFFSTAKTSPLARCNSRKLPSVIVHYQSAPGAVGKDTFTLRIIWADAGVAESTPVTITIQ
jgi:hypothetical protein